MSATSKWRGHEIEFQNNNWIYKNTQLSVEETHEKMPCGNCGKQPTEEGHDVCLGTLIGVMNACCGHGEEGDAYVQFLDGNSIHGKDAVVILNILKKYNK